METGSGNSRRFVLAGAALLLGGAVPVQLVTLSFGYAQYIRHAPMGPETLATAHQFAALYIPFVYLPAMVGVLAIALYSRRRYGDLARRIVVGLGAGATATLVLDAIRQMGVINEWLPGDTVVMFGKMATGSTSFAVFCRRGFWSTTSMAPASA